MTDIVDRLRAELEYDPNTGIVVWRKDQPLTAIKAGALAGHLSSGYYRLGFRGRKYQLHRVIWALHYGTYPGSIIDHINGDKLDNRIVNLRLASAQQNSWNQRVSKNNTTGFKGVTKRESGGYSACIRVNKNRLSLGTFKTAEQAAIAYNKAAALLYGDFAYANDV